MQPNSRILLLAAFMLAVTPGVAHAYLDPGTASMLLQAVIGMIAAAVVTLRLYWRRIRDTIARWLGRDSSQASPSQSSDATDERDAPR